MFQTTNQDKLTNRGLSTIGLLITKWDVTLITIFITYFLWI